MTQESDEAGTVSRRAFLRGAGMGGGAMGAVAFASVAVASAGRLDPTTTAPSTGPEARAAGYRESEHVRRVYDLARF